MRGPSPARPFPCLREEAVAATNAEHLALIDAVITSILDGGAVIAYSIGGRNATKQDLPALYEIRNMLSAKVAAETGTDHFTYPDFRPDG